MGWFRERFNVLFLAFAFELFAAYLLLPFSPSKDFAAMIFVALHFFLIPLTCFLLLVEFILSSIRRKSWSWIVGLRAVVVAVGVGVVWLLLVRPQWPMEFLGLTFAR